MSVGLQGSPEEEIPGSARRVLARVLSEIGCSREAPSSAHDGALSL